MIDLHCHILPGLDDGARNVADSIEMARKAANDGITQILCTPHHNRKYRNPKNRIVLAVEQLQKELDKEKIPIKLLVGQEVRIHGELLKEIEEDKIVFIDSNHTYVLLEFPVKEIPLYAEKLIESLIEKKHIPIIVHPECNLEFQRDVNKLVRFLDMGILAQMTAPSIVGRYGKKVQKTADKMLKHRMVQMVASDAHRLEMRNFYLKEAYAYVDEHYGTNRVSEMKQVAKDVTKGIPIDNSGYSYAQNQRFWWMKKFKS